MLENKNNRVLNKNTLLDHILKKAVRIKSYDHIHLISLIKIHVIQIYLKKAEKSVKEKIIFIVLTGHFSNGFRK